MSRCRFRLIVLLTTMEFGRGEYQAKELPQTPKLRTRIYNRITSAFASIPDVFTFERSKQTYTVSEYPNKKSTVFTRLFKRPKQTYTVYRRQFTLKPTLRTKIVNRVTSTFSRTHIATLEDNLYVAKYPTEVSLCFGPVLLAESSCTTHL